MIADIANELHRARREAITMGLPAWMVEKGLRVEVNEIDLCEAWYRERSMLTHEPPMEIIGISIYAIPPRFKQLPSPGWRIINPFIKPARRPDYSKSGEAHTFDTTQRAR